MPEIIVVQTRGLTRRFGEVRAVDGINLSIRAGEIFGLLGHNGAGKTTVIKMLTTLLPVTSGQTFVAGFDVQKQSSQVRSSIGYVPQLVSADGALTARENLMIFARLQGIPRSQRESRVREFLDFVGLNDAAERVVRGYSGGMIRRLEIAMAMLHHPRVLFLDEPTVGLDPLARQSVWEQVRRAAAEYGTTVLLTTHFMDEADSLCDRVAIMNRGRVTVCGNPEDLKRSIDSPEASMDGVFAYYSDEHVETEGNLHEISQARRSIARLG